MKRLKKYKFTVLVGIPCSGKSTFTETLQNTIILSRDKIRETHWNGYKYTYANEEKVSDILNDMFLKAIKKDKDIVVDNTHCREKYIDEWILKVPMRYKIQIKRFEIPKWRANIRNVIRWVFTGKWIPFKIMTSMEENYKKINWKKYEQYLIK